MILVCIYKYVISFVFVFKIIIKKEPCRYRFFDEFNYKPPPPAPHATTLIGQILIESNCTWGLN